MIPLVEFDDLVQLYFPDDSVRVELHMWNANLKRLNMKLNIGLNALKGYSELIYPNLSKLF